MRVVTILILYNIWLYVPKQWSHGEIAMQKFKRLAGVVTLLSILSLSGCCLFDPFGGPHGGGGRGGHSGGPGGGHGGGGGPR